MTKLYIFLFLTLSIVAGNAQIINFPADSNFKWVLLQSATTTAIAIDVNNNAIQIDANNNNEIEISEAQSVYKLNINQRQLSDLQWLSYFTSLKKLDCSSNALTTLNVSALSNLEVLDCSTNNLTTLDVSGLSHLTALVCRQNRLTSLEFNNCPNILGIDCSVNNLIALDVSSLQRLYQLYCYTNELRTLNLGILPELFILECSQNQLTDLKLSGLTVINRIDCNGNLLTTLDVSNLADLEILYCAVNPMLALYMSYVGPNLSQFYNPSIYSPTLKYICIELGRQGALRNALYDTPLNTVEINSYCSFNLPWLFYNINASAKFDAGNNGCDSNDIPFQNLKYRVNTNGLFGSLTQTRTGNASIPLREGTHVISPILPNPSYFTFSPASATVTFPGQTSPAIANFYMVPNGIHNDLEISIFPMTVAKPGFDAVYKIIYKNNGTTTQSGTVNLNFNDAIMNRVSTSPVLTTQSTNVLSWAFTNLKPLEAKEITVIFNINSQMDTPPVTMQDNLSYTATIIGATDLTPVDNTALLRQRVVSSWDPNDKTCLEGETVGPELIGKYVHYMIRFENTGTFAAENVVVKDMIDLSKFDVNSIDVLSSSHPVETKFSGSNKIEFIFENINLPFDDANNDGYVVFKIKTKSILVVGNSFSNQANIYFDYNSPIVTNNATTTIAALSVNDFEFSSYFTLYPNPAEEMLNINTRKNIKISSISIYDISGRLIQSISNPEINSGIDVSSLKTGNYFLKINSDKGTTNAKFAKK
ncbi:hypothetical protein FNO01nite_23960 [Flavobacterium noncentrifugens]|uniref:Conserved repeat domain-containing protein/Por secretion system C-terminal sorting domain-containing protein n=1 Tax=Flavobacterium noncentrifugens TaxID=1128970 RepID=A0A1G9A3Q3_9FLAO|nr:T9SS type A sorting domain-containing protein [Flavobacterium noncentrifugens]GEP51724.1 hypothetical protein FNO01nite_23960 [Flavobacterium noncentrifugens]SDK21877.1 conserved repeat domain-containing protein/Por secretion system C-terminal sorting domain-containing protein [Flavobacterium noncentrifugens]